MGAYKKIRSKKLISTIIILTLAFSLLNCLGSVNYSKAWQPDPPSYGAPPVINIPSGNTMRYYRDVPFVDINLKEHTTDADTNVNQLSFSSSVSSMFDITIDDGWARVELTSYWGDTITFTAEDPEGNTGSQDIDFVVYSDLPDSEGPKTLDATNILQTTATTNGERMNKMAPLSFRVDNDCDWWVHQNLGSWEEDATGFSGDIIFSDIEGLTEGKIYFYRAKQVIWSGSVGTWYLGELKWFIAGESPNTAPNTPSQPSGPISLEVGESGSYISSAIDPDGDDIEYKFRWGDGTNSGWVGPYSSGESISLSHSYSSEGTFNIDVRARDPDDARSARSDVLAVTASITEGNSDPVAVDDSFEVYQGTKLNSFDVITGSDSDPDGDAISIDSFTPPLLGSLYKDGNDFLYSPNSGQSEGSDEFTYTIDDGKGGFDTATVTININPTDQPIVQPPSIDPNDISTCYSDIDYKFTSYVPDADSSALIDYKFDWGDGSESVDWIGPFAYDENGEGTHSWANSGVYIIRVKARVDPNDGSDVIITGWSKPLAVLIENGFENPDDAEQVGDGY